MLAVSVHIATELLKIAIMQELSLLSMIMLAD